MGQLVKRHIGRILLDGGFVSQHHLDRALEEQKHTKELLGHVLVRMEVLKAEDVKVPLMLQEHFGNIGDAVKLAAGERQLLGALLIQSGHISSKQLDHAIAEQERSGEKIGEVFKRLGMLTELQLNVLLDFQRNQEDVFNSPLRLGELLVTIGHLNREQLEIALHQQSISNKKLGEVLVEAGYVNSSHIEHGLHLQKMLLKAVLVAILSLEMIPVGLTEGTAYAGCLFSEQVQSSPMREQYIANLARNADSLAIHNTTNQIEADTSDDSFSLGEYSEEKSSSTNQEGDIDSYSKKCLTCHDGALAIDIKVNYKNASKNKITGSNVTHEHPIGMDYDAYVTAYPNSYKPIKAFNTKMIFANGRVGCLTCHYPLNANKSHLVTSDFQSALCLTCHNK